MTAKKSTLGIVPALLANNADAIFTITYTYDAPYPYTIVVLKSNCLRKSKKFTADGFADLMQDLDNLIEDEAIEIERQIDATEEDEA